MLDHLEQIVTLFLQVKKKLYFALLIQLQKLSV
jgi:hypothetical protein